ncbi:MAG: DUF6427 family protein [Ferruginibacter sp.]
MTGTFKANNPNNNFLLLLYGLAIKFHLFLYPPQPKLQGSDGILYRSFVNWLIRNFAGAPFVFSLISFALLYIHAVSFNKLVNDQRMMQRPNYLPGMSYLLVTSLFSDWFPLSAALFANTLLIWVWAKLSGLHNASSPKGTIFNIGLAIGLAAFFYTPSILFIVLFITGLATTRPFRLNEWLLGMLGIFTCYYFYAAWIFISGRWKTYKLPGFDIALPRLVIDRWEVTALILVVLGVLMGLVFMRTQMRRQLVQTRKSWQLIYLYLLVAAIIPFFNADGFNSWILAAVPASLILAAAFFYPDKKWFPLGLHWAMVALAITIGYFIR